LSELTLENIEFSAQSYRKICGIHDRNIPLFEELLAARIVPRGNSWSLHRGEESPQSSEIRAFFSSVESFTTNLEADQELEQFDIRKIFDQMDNTEEPVLNDKKFKIYTTFRGRSIYPKTDAQSRFVQTCREKAITLAVGPAGTGKTYLSVALACASLSNGPVEKLVLSRPAVEAGESLGFLPGDMASKVDPYLRPLYDSLYECLGIEKVQQMIAAGNIEVAPLAFMRGRNIANSWIILDEAQNCTYNQLKMILTRLGRNSRMIVCGDITQVDLHKKESGLQRIIERLQRVEEIGTVYFTEKDICRHPLVEKIVRALKE
jgi:phosphate starvation-inducible PhoH-like protein